MSNEQLYLHVAGLTGIASAALDGLGPIGRSGEKHSKLTRPIRFEQQTLNAAGFIERVRGKQGVWSLTRRVGKLHIAEIGTTVLAFTTDLGAALLGGCETVFRPVRWNLALVLTSRVYPIAHGRAHGKVGSAPT